MIGVFLNAGGIVVGCLLGLLMKKGIPERVEKAVMTALGLCVAIIGIQGTFKSENTLVMIVSMVLGTLLGTAVDIDRWVNRLGQKVEERFTRPGEKSRIAEGFVSGTLLYCIGAMAIVGSLNAGLQNDIGMLVTKTLLDFVSAIMLSVSLGVGIALSGLSVFVYQGLIVALAGVLQPVLTETAIADLTCVGSLMIVAIGLNLIGITKIKVANFLPALLFTPLLTWLSGMVF